ncbi:MAG: MotA/TolQ/ExbB proton channel family protein [Verrucomicrobiota bacterium]
MKFPSITIRPVVFFQPLLRRPLAWVTLALLAFTFAAAPLSSYGQEGEEAPAGEVAEADAHGDKTFIDVFLEGGPVMWPLLFASILVVSFTLEGFFKLRKNKLAPPALAAQLQDLMTQQDYQGAWTACQSNKSFLSRVVATGLERLGHGKDSVEFALQEASLREGTKVKSNTQYLSVIGVVSPMIGLTGTVIGMIRAFQALGQTGIGDPSALSAAIGEVLVATAGGLAVAIPAFVFFYVLKNIAQGAVLEAESVVYRLFESIPYDQLSGLQIGETYSPATGAGGSASSRMRSARVSQAVQQQASQQGGPQAMEYESWAAQVQQLNPQFAIDRNDPGLRAVYESGMPPHEVQFDTV